MSESQRGRGRRWAISWRCLAGAARNFTIGFDKMRLSWGEAGVLEEKDSCADLTQALAEPRGVQKDGPFNCRCVERDVGVAADVPLRGICSHGDASLARCDVKRSGC